MNSIFCSATSFCSLYIPSLLHFLRLFHETLFEINSLIFKKFAVSNILNICWNIFSPFMKYSQAWWFFLLGCEDYNEFALAQPRERSYHWGHPVHREWTGSDHRQLLSIPLFILYPLFFLCAYFVDLTADTSVPPHTTSRSVLFSVFVLVLPVKPVCLPDLPFFFKFSGWGYLHMLLLFS